MNIQWYPGHMAKAKRMMKENLQLVDLVVELLDARIPISSQNPDLESMTKHKKRILVLNKADLADEKANLLWKKYFEGKGTPVVLANAKDNKGLQEIYPIARMAMKERIESQMARGRKMVPIRAMIVGIPNVGKSTLINQIAGKKVAKTADKPGVTRGKQWVRLKKDFELLDTPGLLWPKQSDNKVAKHLAFMGTFRDDITEQVEVARYLADFLYEYHREALESRYNIKNTDNDILLAIGKARGFLQKGGVVDDLRTAMVFLDEFRGGKIGRISLELPPGSQEKGR